MTHRGHGARLRAPVLLLVLVPLGLVLGAWVQPVTAASIVLVRVTSEGLNIRAGPSGETPIVGYQRRGDTLVATIGSFERWLLVMTRDRKPGYVSAAHVELVRVLAVDGGQAAPSSSAPGAAVGPGCGAGELTELQIESVDLRCDDGPPGAGIAGCVARFSVTASGCGDIEYRPVECEGRFFHRLDGEDQERLDTVRGSGVLALHHGYGSAVVDVDWLPPTDAPPVVRARLEDGTCIIR